MNLMMTLAGLAFGAGFLHFNTPNGRGSYIFYLFIYGAAPLFSIAVVNYVVLLYLNSCAGCCCGSFIERSGLDIDTFEVVDLEEVQSEFEMIYIQKKMFLLTCIIIENKKYVISSSLHGYKLYQK